MTTPGDKLRLVGKLLTVIGSGVVRRADGKCITCGAEVDTFKTLENGQKVKDNVCRGCAGKAARSIGQVFVDAVWRK